MSNLKPLDTQATPSQLFTQNEAAELLGVDVGTLWRWRNAKAITCRKRGRWIRYTAEDIQLFIDESAVEAIKSKRTDRIKQEYQRRQTTMATPANDDQKTEKEKEILEKLAAFRELWRWLFSPEADALLSGEQFNENRSTDRG